MAARRARRARRCSRRRSSAAGSTAASSARRSASHRRFRKRGTESLYEYGTEWVSSSAKRQCDRNPRSPAWVPWASRSRPQRPGSCTTTAAGARWTRTATRRRARCRRAPCPRPCSSPRSGPPPGAAARRRRPSSAPAGHIRHPPTGIRGEPPPDPPSARSCHNQVRVHRAGLRRATHPSGGAESLASVRAWPRSLERGHFQRRKPRAGMETVAMGCCRRSGVSPISDPE